MVIKEHCGKKYKLVASSEKRIGTVLMAIRRVDLVLLKTKRPRIKRVEKQKIILSNVDYSSFERGLIKQISEFKKQKKSAI